MNILSTRWTKRFLTMAHLISDWSKDDSTRVGAIIVTSDGDPISFGFNGFPRGVEELPERHERPDKYDFSEHAERNAIYLSRRDLRDTVMFVTHFPCPDCTRAIIQSGIKTLVVDAHSSDRINGESSLNDTTRKINSRNMLSEARVRVIDFFDWET